MQQCELSYIPKNLHFVGKPIIKEFRIGELLFRRCTPDELENPFQTITITELSVNRSGIDEVLSKEEDVLFCIKHDESFEKYNDKVVCTLKIISLSDDNQYDKTFSRENGDLNVKARMVLLHDPLICMYPHCVFRIWFNGEIVTYDNYKKTLKKQDEIRTKIKNELASMIYRKEVRQKDI